MPGWGQAAETVELLARSEARASVLTTVHEEGPVTRRELVEQLRASKRTITRAAKTLIDEGHLEESTEGYRTTAYGDMIAEVFQRCHERVALIEQYRPFLSDIDAEELDLDPEYLRGAELSTPGRQTPYVLRDQILDVRAEATHIRQLCLGIGKRSVSQLAERVQAGDEVSVEFVLPEGAFDLAADHPSYAAEHAITRESDRVAYYEYPGHPPLFVAVMDETVLLATGNSQGLTSLVESDREELREWASNRIDEAIATSTPVAPPSRN